MTLHENLLGLRQAEETEDTQTGADVAAEAVETPVLEAPDYRSMLGDGFDDIEGDTPEQILPALAERARAAREYDEERQQLRQQLQIQQYIAAQQRQMQQPAPREETPPPRYPGEGPLSHWSKSPEWDESLTSHLRMNQETGQYESTNGDPTLVAKYLAYRDWQARGVQSIAKDPMSVIEQAFLHSPQIAESIDRYVQQHIYAVQQQAQVEKVRDAALREVYEHDEYGRPQYDEAGNRKKLAHTDAYLRALHELHQDPALRPVLDADPAKHHRMAMNAALASTRQTTKPADEQRQTAKSKVTNRNPGVNRSGSVPNAATPGKRIQNGSSDFGAMLTEAFKSKGFDLSEPLD